MTKDEALVVQQLSFARHQLNSASASSHRFDTNSHLQASVLQLSLGVRSFLSSLLPGSSPDGAYQALSGLDFGKVQGDLAEWVNLLVLSGSWLNKLIAMDPYESTFSAVDENKNIIATTFFPPITGSLVDELAELTIEDLEIVLEAAREIVERQINDAVEC